MKTEIEEKAIALFDQRFGIEMISRFRKVEEEFNETKEALEKYLEIPSFGKAKENTEHLKDEISDLYATVTYFASLFNLNHVQMFQMSIDKFMKRQENHEYKRFRNLNRNKMKQFNGKAIYNPSGKAGEYSYWACNFYVGCSNGCEYCYCKKGILAGTMGQDKPQLKKCFKDETHALQVFESELSTNIIELQKHGLFFSFTTDPMLPETQTLTMNAAGLAVSYGVPVKILTKCASWVENFIWWINNSNSDNAELEWRKMYAFGFTLTGHDELEPNASTNTERIEAMRKLYVAGFKTFSSIEPIIDFERSYLMISESAKYCDLFKIGLMAGKKYDNGELTNFAYKVMSNNRVKAIYFKDGFLKQIGILRENLPDYCVDRDYNIFT